MDLFALGGFAFAASITPGPNNVMLWASGLNFGLRRTVPHLLGVNLGFASLLAVIGLGLGSIIAAEPTVGLVIKGLGGVYLLYLAWRVATADVGEDPAPTDRAPAGDDAVARPLTFTQAAAFQYVNPKAWVMGPTAAGIALPDDMALRSSVPLFVVTFALVGLPCIIVWAGAGNIMGRALSDLRWRRRVNVTLGVVLAASVVLFVT